MKKNLLQYIKKIPFLLGCSVLIFACKKELIVDADYPGQVIYLSQAAVATVGPGANGIFTVTPKIHGQSYRYMLDAAAAKFKVPMSVLRSGVDLSGSITSTLSINNDTITRLITLGRLAPGTVVLPASAYTLPSSIELADGRTEAGFDLVVDLNFLINNLATKYAVAVTLSNAKSGVVNPKMETAVIFIDPSAVLLPVANFSTAVDNTAKSASFTNLSANGVSYSWNYGDGSPVETTASPIHKYSAAGVYTVTLTTTGVTGTPSVKTTNITIL